MTTPYVDPQTIHNPAAGGKPPATWGDTVRDDLEFLSRPPSCKVTRSTVQVITHNTEMAIVFDAANASENWDTDGFHSPSTNPARLTVPAGLGGRYVVQGYGIWESNTAGNRQLYIRKNGSSNVATAFTDSAAGIARFSVDTEIALSAGDYVDLVAWHNAGSGVELDLLVEFWLRWVSRV